MDEIKKKNINFFSKPDIPFITFITYLKSDQKINICMHTKIETYKRIANFMNNAHKKLKCIKGLVIL